MSEEMIVTNYFKSMPTASSTSGKKVVYVDSEGNFSKSSFDGCAEKSNFLKMKRLTNEDLNDITENYQLEVFFADGGNSVQNSPLASAGFYLEVFGLSSQYVVQIMHEASGDSTYKRVKSDNIWKSWKKITSVAI